MMLSLLLAIVTATQPAAPLEKWMVLRSKATGHILSVRPTLPAAEIREKFSTAARVTWDYSTVSETMPPEDMLQAMHAFEDRLREADPQETVFLQAVREVGSGMRSWTFYATSEPAMEALIEPLKPAQCKVSYEVDPDWSDLARVLDRTPG